MTPGLFFIQTFCKSFRIRWHRDFFKPAPSWSSLPRACQKMCTRDWNFPVRRQKPRPENRTSRRCGFVHEVRAGRTLPDSMTAGVPDAWSPGDSLTSTGVSDAEVGGTAIDILMSRTGSSITTSARSVGGEGRRCCRAWLNTLMKQPSTFGRTVSVRRRTKLADGGSSTLRISPCSVKCAETLPVRWL